MLAPAPFVLLQEMDDRQSHLPPAGRPGSACQAPGVAREVEQIVICWKAMLRLNSVFPQRLLPWRRRRCPASHRFDRSRRTVRRLAADDAEVLLGDRIAVLVSC